MGKKLSLLLIPLLFMSLVAAIAVPAPKPASAACAALPTDKGTVSMNFTIPATGTYTVWSRIMAADANANSYLLDIDSASNGLCGAIVGDSGVSTTAWTWVNWRNGNANDKITLNLNAGNHTILMAGREAGVKLDRVILTADPNCVPSGIGDNCANGSGGDSSGSKRITVGDKCLDNNNGTLANANKVQINTCNNSAAQNWTVGTDNTIRAGSSNYCLDVLAGGTTAGTLVQLYDCNEYPNNQAQKWTINGDGTIKNPQSNMCLAVRGGSTANGTVVEIQPCNANSAAQKWTVGTSLAEDINQDGKVNLLDFSLLAAKFNQTGANLGRADINKDNAVNLLDFSLLSTKFGYGQ